MKNLFFLSCFLLLCFSCKKESNSVCTTSNPLEDIEWLKETHETFQKHQGPNGAQIFQYEYKGECVFLIDDCYNCADALTVVYNEAQEVICEFGGFAGLNTCPDFDTEKTNEILLYDGVE